MITIKELRWSNAFSYGANNQLDFSANALTQLVGRNGHGKSSIALILEEVLFNKNSKGIKKADILNRYVAGKSYSIELDFNRDGVDYTIKTQRGSTQTVKLFCGTEDISAHTATATYKHIEQILGFDHRTFTQIVYQSNASSLEFLTAADTARKKFLIEILNLSQYTRAQETFKSLAQDLSRDIGTTQAKVNTVSSWLDKYEQQDLTPMDSCAVPELDSELATKASELRTAIVNIDQTNKKISQNNTYKQVLNGIQLMPLPAKPTANIAQLQSEATILQKTIRDAEQFVSKMRALDKTCPTCLSTIDDQKVQELVDDRTSEQTSARLQKQELDDQIKEAQKALNDWAHAVEQQSNWEKYHQLIDVELPDTVLDKNSLQLELSALESSIADSRKRIEQAQRHNQQAAAHNSKVELLTKQLAEMTTELEVHSGILHDLSEKMGVINILNKTFSTTGLVAYKIECLVKDLEEITNYYLVDLSDGRFQISFKISSSDKLNVVITDNGNDIEMQALSGGERARVNVATLLAIRKLMQTLSSSRINLLILDETVETLDVDGKEKLVEVLLREEHLNTFLVSHGFTHPLLEKVNVIKTNNISQIEV